MNVSVLQISRPEINWNNRHMFEKAFETFHIYTLSEKNETNIIVYTILTNSNAHF